MSAEDAVEVLAREFRMVRVAHGLTEDLTPSDTDRREARRALGNLWVRGWRTVDLVEADNPGKPLHVPDDATHWVIAAEWTPEALR